MDALLWEVLSKGSPDDTVEVLIKLSDIRKIPKHISILAQIGDITSCRILRGDIELIRQDPNVVSMKASKTFAPDPPIFEEFVETIQYDDTEASTRRPETHLTGRDIAIGLADWGLDFTHPNFLDLQGDSRFMALWDQSADYDGTNRYGYGRIHYQEEINEALSNGQPFQALGYHPGKSDIFHQGMHGTHVLDIAAGNGAVGVPGVAPDADLIGVHLATEKFKDLMGLGESSRVFDAIHFMDEIANTQALVINLSVGSHGDAHMGRSLIEQAIDYLVTSKPNRAVVQSCGNYFTGRTHSKGHLLQGQELVLEWLISENDKTPNEIEIWYESSDHVVVDLISPDDEIVLQNRTIGKVKILDNNGNKLGQYYSRDNEPNTTLSQVLIILNENAPFGKWKVVLKGEKIISGQLEAWIERDNSSSLNSQSKFPIYQVEHTMTTGSICNGKHTISVGAINPRDNKIGFFSSVGPTWDGRQVPFLSAPGVGILAAKSASPYQTHSAGELTYKTGTSMAAPYVTGAVALLYESVSVPMSIEELKSRLSAACAPAIFDKQNDKDRYGNGILNINQLLEPYQKQTIASTQSQHSKMMDMKNFEPEFITIESLLEYFNEAFPELTSESAADFFESLPSEGYSNDDFDIQPGDLLIKRNYAYHDPVTYGVVESIMNDEASIFTKKGSKKVKVPQGGHKSKWNLKTIKSKNIGNKRADEPVPDQEDPTPDQDEAPTTNTTVSQDDNDAVSEAMVIKNIQINTLTKPSLINKSYQRPGFDEALIKGKYVSNIVLDNKANGLIINEAKFNYSDLDVRLSTIKKQINKIYDSLNEEEKFILELPLHEWNLGYKFGAYCMLNWLEGSTQSLKFQYDRFMIPRLKNIDKTSIENYFGSLRYLSVDNLGYTPSGINNPNQYLYNTSLKTVKNSHDLFLSDYKKYLDTGKIIGDYENFNSHISDKLIKNNFFNSVDFGSSFGDFDDLGVSVGKFSLRMYYRGFLYSGNTVKVLEIQDVATRFVDTYSFNDNNSWYSQPLGCWNININTPGVARLRLYPIDGKICVENRDFINLKEKVNKKEVKIGGDFLIYSDHRIHSDDIIKKEITVLIS